MQMDHHAFGRNKDTVTFKEIEHKTLAAHTAAAVYAKQCVKAAGIGFEIHQTPLDLGIEQYPLYLKIFTTN